MYTTKVTYNDEFTGNQVTRDLYFNLTKAEITKLQLSYKDGFDKYVRSVIDSEDPAKIMDMFEMLILKAYGVRTPEGDFLKSKERSEAFATTEAYSELFMRLIQSQEEQEKFFMGVIPKDLAEAASAEMKKIENQENNVVAIDEVKATPTV